MEVRISKFLLDAMKCFRVDLYCDRRVLNVGAVMMFDMMCSRYPVQRVTIRDFLSVRQLRAPGESFPGVGKVWNPWNGRLREGTPALAPGGFRRGWLQSIASYENNPNNLELYTAS
jgi:hypothetical protein